MKAEPPAWVALTLRTITALLPKDAPTPLREAVLGTKAAVHLAIMTEPWMGLVLRGEKTVETRFSERRVLPFECVKPGDVLAFKRTGGPLTALARAAMTVDLEGWYRMPQAARDAQRELLGARVGTVDDAFWEARRLKHYATFVHFEHLTPLEGGLLSWTATSDKRDRRPWVVLREPWPPRTPDTRGLTLKGVR